MTCGSCGYCDDCDRRAAARPGNFRQRNRRVPKVLGPQPRKERAPKPRRAPVPVAWCDYLTAIRDAAGGSKKGTCVSIGQAGIVVDRVGHERLVFTTIDDALEWATTPRSGS